MTWNFVVNGVHRFVIEARHSWWTGEYSLYAISYPPDPFRGSVTQNHLYASGQICVSSGNEPKTLERAKAIAMAWCEGYSTYLRTRQFPNGPKKITVN